MSLQKPSRWVNKQEEPKTIKKILEFMEKELPPKFASLTGEKMASAEPKLEKREKPENKTEEKKQQAKEGNHENNKQPTNEETKDEKGGILDRIKPRPNNVKTKKVKETTEGTTEQPKDEQKEVGDKPKRDPAKTRCNFWPSCKTEDCPYVHPSQPVS